VHGERVAESREGGAAAAGPAEAAAAAGVWRGDWAGAGRGGPDPEELELFVRSMLS
jgi:hypothetical protein